MSKTVGDQQASKPERDAEMQAEHERNIQAGLALRAGRALRSGDDFPFDSTDAWWYAASGSEPPPEAKDWTHRAARGIIADLRDRRAVKRGLQVDKIEESVRAEIVQSIAAIIRQALWEAANERRCELVERGLQGMLTAAETTELEHLNEYADRHLERVAPRPTELLEALEKKIYKDQ